MQKIILKLSYSLVFVFLIIFFFVFFDKENYDIKISMKIDDLSAGKIDEIYAKNLSDELLNTKNIKDFIIISRQNYCNIYIKTKFLRKNTENIKIKIDNVLSKFDLNAEVDFDYDFKTRYNSFLIIYSEINDISTLKKYFDLSYNLLQKEKTIKRLLKFEQNEVKDYIYFKNSTLTTYDVTLEDIKKTIEENNVLKNQIKTNSYPFKTGFNSEIKSIEDVENIKLYFKDKNFSISFKDVFDIVEIHKNPFDFKVKFQNKDANLILISKNWYVPEFLFNFLLKRKIAKINPPDFINFKIVSPKSYSKIETILNESDLNLFEDEKNIIYFINTSIPKTSLKENFVEIDKNKITILTKNPKQIKNILKKEDKTYLSNKKIKLKSIELEKLNKKINEDYSKYYSDFLNTQKIVFYNLNNQNINDYLFLKQEIINSIQANNEGLKCSSYYKNSNKIDIILKNKENNDFIYSKNYKSLLSINSFAKKELKEEYSTIARKNGVFYTEVKFKN